MVPSLHSRSILPLLIRSLIISGFLLQGVLLAVSSAQITLDGSLGPKGALAGPDYAIDAKVGQLHGHNLFHSFGEFNVRTRESATFTGPDTVHNIIGRVTGGHASDIDGTVRSEIPKANLYLLNPSGVMFGQNAALDVKGSFHVSTADYLRFTDGEKFHADLTKGSGLSVAPPEAFGFLSDHPAPIAIEGSSLRVPEGKTLSVVGGDIEIVGGTTTANGEGPSLGAPSGRINIASVGSRGEVIPNSSAQGSDLQVESFTRLGDIKLSQQAVVDTSGEGGGTVFIRGGRLVMDNSLIEDNTFGKTDSGGIHIAVTDNLTVSNGAKIDAFTFGAGTGGSIEVQADSIILSVAKEKLGAGTGIGTISQGANGGRAGDVRITTRSLQMSGGALIGAATLGTGNGGSVTVQADSVVLAGVDEKLRFSTGIAATAERGSSGRAGDIRITTGSLQMSGGAAINASTRGAGAGGSIEVQADSMVLSGANEELGFPTGIGANAERGSSGNAGDVRITTRSLQMSGGAAILALTFGAGAGGSIEVQADSMVLSGVNEKLKAATAIAASAERGSSGRAGDIRITTRGLQMSGGAQIPALTAGAGAGGSIEVKADSMVLSGANEKLGAVTGIGTNSQGKNSGRAGDVQITTGSLQMSGGAQIAAGTFGAGAGGSIEVKADSMVLSGANEKLGAHTLIGTAARRGSSGRAGDIQITTGSLQMTDGAQIGASTFGSGQGGAVSLSTTGTVSISGRDSGLFSSSLGDGLGGNIRVQAHQVNLSDGALISARSSGQGNAGNILIQASDTFRSQNSAVTTEAETADGGNITLHAGSLVHLRDSRITAEVKSGVGKGGNITIDPRFVILNRSQIRADAFGGPGGNVRIVSDVFLASPEPDKSEVSASSTLGVAGTVDIRAPVTNLSGTFAPLPEVFLSVGELLGQRCAERLRGGKYSSFVLGGRDGLPQEPGSSLLSSPLDLESQTGAPPTRNK